MYIVSQLYLQIYKKKCLPLYRLHNLKTLELKGLQNSTLTWNSTPTLTLLGLYSVTQSSLLSTTRRFTSFPESMGPAVLDLQLIVYNPIRFSASITFNWITPSSTLSFSNCCAYNKECNILATLYTSIQVVAVMLVVQSIISNFRIYLLLLCMVRGHCVVNRK